MNDNKQQSRRPPKTIKPRKRFGRHSTKKRATFRPPAHPGRWIGGSLAVVAIITVALVWGNALKQKSDAYRADKEAGLWTLPSEATVDSPAPLLPNSHLLEIKPEGNVGDIIIYNSHDGVLLPLRDAMGSLSYRSDIAAEAGLTVPTDAVTLSQDVQRVSRRGLRVAGIYHVSCFDTNDEATHIYRRGLDLSLLREYAASGIHEILLLGLPCGTDEKDALAGYFLEDLNHLLSTIPSPPAIGVALPLSAFERTDTGEETVDDASPYIGGISPGRIDQRSDYLALDVRHTTAEEMEEILPRMAYIYQRYNLRMLVNREDSSIAEDLASHGFARIYEMRKPETITNHA